ncbi:MAG: RtcB family protein [Gammaproteobacteria bacterium]
MKKLTAADFVAAGPATWEVPRSFREDMRVPARVYGTPAMLEAIVADGSAQQLVNVATLPGIVHYALAMPDIHLGYGFPIGGVAAIDPRDGVISPGGVGYDINCGVRLLTSPATAAEIGDRVVALANQIQRDVPSGIGRGGRLALGAAEMDEVLARGARWAVDRDLATADDLDRLEDGGCLACADPARVPERAKARGAGQLGTIGAGNHFIEIQQVVEIFDPERAERFGLRADQVTIMVHTGSRGLGHQTCTEYVRAMDRAMSRYGILLPDRQLACVPFDSPEGRDYFAAMCAAANFAFANRQVITHRVRHAWDRIVGGVGGLEVLYDVCHNIAKLERHDDRELLVHRKGATRAFAPGNPAVPARYRDAGQPVLVPGSMGTASYVLAGSEGAATHSFGSCCHGAGRRLSRSGAKRSLDYNRLRRELTDYGVVVRSGSAKGLLEEAPQAYKDIDEVIEVVHAADLARKVARLRPLAVIKG